MIFRISLYQPVSKVSKPTLDTLDTLDTSYYTNIQKKTGLRNG
jgi:ABC-type uncharacterized transport system substrate-binding protein